MSKSILTIGVTLVAVVALTVVLTGKQVVEAQSSTETTTPTPTATVAPQPDLEELRQQLSELAQPQHPKLDSNLNRIVEQAQTGQFSAQAAAANAPVHSGASVAVTLYITEGYADAVREFLEANGGDPRNIGTDYIEAYIPMSLLPAASEREGVISIRTIIPPESNQSAVVSEGAAAHGAPAWHAAGYKGQGVKIGVIDRFEGFSGLMGSELPDSVEARCYTDIGQFGSDLSDCETTSKHGTALTEILFDIAPEATYYISNPSTRGDLKTAVEWMVAQDVDVIGYGRVWIWEGPGDGTTPFSDGALRSVDSAVDGGIIWVSAAGNYAERTWFGDVRKGISGFFHVFEGINHRNHVNLKAGERFRVQLRWEDTWGGATKNLNLNLFSPAGEIAVSSLNSQSGGAEDDPFEFLSYTPSADGRYYLTVSYHLSPNEADPRWIQVQSWGADLEYHTLKGSIANPAESANPGLLAVGAAPGNDTSTIRSYSSRGPTPDDRVKPDIVGADGVSTATRSAFGGTSVSSAHVAGLAALVKQRFPEYGPQQIAQYLKDHAEERGAAGADNVWGHGFAKLLASDASPDDTMSISELIDRYDTNSNGRIDKSEALAAVVDYLFHGTLTKEQALQVVNLYLFG